MSSPDVVRVAAVQMVSGLCVEENQAQAAYWIAQAARQGARWIALPEFFPLMGASDEQRLSLAEPYGQGPLQVFLAEQARRWGIYLHGGTVPLKSPDPERVLNSSLVFDPQGGCMARYDKIHLFRFDGVHESHDEARHIYPGEAVTAFDGGEIGRVGLGICYDLRFPELFRSMGSVNLLIIPAAFTQTTGQAHWEVLLRARAIENQCYVLAPAQGGTHPHGRVTHGHSLLVDPWGEIQDGLPQGEGLVIGDVSLKRLTSVRSSLPALSHRVM